MSQQRIIRKDQAFDGAATFLLACGHQKAGDLKIGKTTECASCLHLASIAARRARRQRETQDVHVEALRLKSGVVAPKNV